MKLKRLLAGLVAVAIGSSCTLAASAAGVVSNSQPLEGQESWTTGDNIYCELITQRLEPEDVLNVYEIQIDIVATELTTNVNGAAGEVYVSDNWTESANCMFGPDGYADKVGVDGYISSVTTGTGLNTLSFEKLDGSAFFASEATGGTYFQLTAWDGTFSVETVRYYDANGDLLNREEGKVTATDECGVVMNIDDTYTLDVSGVPATDTIIGIMLNVSALSATDADGWSWGGGGVQFTTGGDTTEFTYEIEWSGLSNSAQSIYVQFTDEIIAERLYSDLIQICYYYGSGDGYFTLESVDIYTRTGDAVIGDVDIDGKRTANDVMCISRHVLGLLALGSDVIAAADINSDTLVNIVDVLGLRRDITGIRDIDAVNFEGSALDFVDSMGIGWNLGNSLDGFNEGSSVAGETGWGNPIVTQELIQAVKGYGFSTVRIPVTWMEHMESDGTIQTTWMQRVNTVVDYAIDEGMYVILNTHWDGNESSETWITNYGSDSSVLTKFKYVWEQIGENFKGYDEHLILEGMNEIGFKDVYNSQGAAAAYKLLNDLNTAFVDTVRAQGSWNAERLLLISGYYTDINETCSMLQYVTLPDDDFIAMSVHYYTPYQFCTEGSQTVWYDSDTTTLQTQFAKMNTNFVSKGIPVIVGEYGYGAGCQASSVCTMVDVLLTEAEKYGMCACIWDQGNGNPVIERTSGNYNMSVSGLANVFASQAN